MTGGGGGGVQWGSRAVPLNLGRARDRWSLISARMWSCVFLIWNKSFNTPPVGSSCVFWWIHALINVVLLQTCLLHAATTSPTCLSSASPCYLLLLTPFAAAVLTGAWLCWIGFTHSHLCTSIFMMTFIAIINPPAPHLNPNHYN